MVGVQAERFKGHARGFDGLPAFLAKANIELHQPGVLSFVSVCAVRSKA